MNTSSAALVGIVGTDDVTPDCSSATGAFNNALTGVGKTVSISGMGLTGAEAANYSLTQPTDQRRYHTAKAVTVNGITASGKIYDGNTAATIDTSGATLAGVIGGDTVTLNTSSATGAFSDNASGNNKTVGISGLVLEGADAAQYTLTQPTVTADITQKTATAGGITADGKVYDGTTVATINTGNVTLAGVIGTDNVTLDVSASAGIFSSAGAGNNKTVSITGSVLTGTEAANYALIVQTASANITPKTVTVTGITAANKVYDGATAARIYPGGATLVGVIGGDTVTLDVSGAAGAFTNADPGQNKTVIISGLALTGTDAANYTLVRPATSANIYSPSSGGIGAVDSSSGTGEETEPEEEPGEEPSGEHTITVVGIGSEPVATDTDGYSLPVTGTRITVSRDGSNLTLNIPVQLEEGRILGSFTDAAGLTFENNRPDDSRPVGDRRRTESAPDRGR